MNEFDRLIKHLSDTSPACSGGDCWQGRACNTPEACRTLREDDGIGCIRGCLWAIGAVGALVAFGAIVAWIAS